MILIDAIVVKIRDGQVANRPIYVAMGVNLNGERDVLGMWVGPTGGEGAKFWAGILTELRNRGIARHVHRLLRRVEGTARCDPGDLAAGRGAVVCRASGALEPAVHVEEVLGSGVPGAARDLHRPHRRCRRGSVRRVRRPLARHYPAMVATWERAWDDFVPFLAFPVELRQIVYTTNAIESLNARFRKAVRHRGHFPTEQSALKVLYLVAIERRKNRSNPTGQINGWKQMLNALTIHYGDRIEAAH